jgi:hypothetical protein
MTHERGERLRVLLALGLGHPYLRPEEAYGELCPEDRDLLAGATEDDFHLANECLWLEAEVRGREYHFASSLLALVWPVEGSIDERVSDLPEPAFQQAVRYAFALGWTEP